MLQESPGGSTIVKADAFVADSLCVLYAIISYGVALAAKFGGILTTIWVFVGGSVVLTWQLYPWALILTASGVYVNPPVYTQIQVSVVPYSPTVGLIEFMTAAQLALWAKRQNEAMEITSKEAVIMVRFGPFIFSSFLYLPAVCLAPAGIIMYTPSKIWLT
jgi:hypothetical protein